MCKSKEVATMFPIPTTNYTAPVSDHDLAHILDINKPLSIGISFLYLFDTIPEFTPSHSQWISNVALHLSWANRTTLYPEYIMRHTRTDTTTVPLDAMLNWFLACSIFLGSSVEEGALKVQDKTYGIPHSYPPRS